MVHGDEAAALVPRAAEYARDLVALAAELFAVGRETEAADAVACCLDALKADGRAVTRRTILVSCIFFRYLFQNTQATARARRRGVRTSQDAASPTTVPI